MTRGRLRGPQLEWAVCSAAWTTKRDPTWPSGIGWCSLLKCSQQGGRVGSRRDCTWILGLSGFRVVSMDEGESGQLVIQIERRGVRRYPCSGCGHRTGTCGRAAIARGMTCRGPCIM